MKKQKQRSENGARKTDRTSIILSMFREFPNNKFSLKHLASASGGATKEGRRETLEILGRLFEEGVVEECAREKYRLMQTHLPHYEGVADMAPSGSVYVKVEGQESDIFVNQRNAANALNGDRVEVVVMHRGRNGQLEGEITRIIERNRKPYVGVAEVGAHQIFVRADSRRMPMDIYLSKRTYPDVRDGEKVVVRIADWLPGSKSPVGELVERLGMAGNNDTEMHSILAEYELPYRFEPEIEEAAQAIDARVTAKEIAQRRDFRHVTTFTVDPADAKDFDDALSVRKIKDGVWEVGVHIADVTHYVRPHSVIDDEAVERGTSVYLVDRTVPMLPERLSNELCSLRPHETSLCFGAHQIFVRADSRRMPMDIYLSKRTYPDVRDGEKVVVRIADWLPGSKSPVGELVERLGMAGNNDTEMHSILAEYELPYRFEPEIEEAAQAIDARVTAKEIAQRRDFRHVTTFTVDPADAKDFDDALSVRKIKDGVWEVGVHIADVTHYVRPHSVIDDEAVERGTSVYLVDRTVPMLPERLSNELCSLRPHETSLCFSAVFTLNENLDILEEWFGRTVIHSDRRFTYAEAQEIIETGRGDYAEEVLTLNRLAQALRKERFRNGAISFDREEVKFRLDENGKPLGVYFKEQKESNQMIEEFMLLANRRVAEFCGKRRTESGRSAERTMVYRVHDTPSEEKLDRFRQFILRFGHIFKATKGRAVAKELNKLFKQIKGTTEENAVATMAVRSMAKAYYTTDNIGHYGLAFPYYTHFTSPIRRYPDMMVHRLLARYLAGGKPADKTELEDLCARASDREVVAAEAERASIKYKMVEFMKEHIGEEFEGHISGLTEWGVYVELDETHIEGMSFLRDIEGDFFTFDEQLYEIIGRSTGIRMTLGSPVRIRVKRADLQKRQLDFELLLPGAAARRTEEPRGKGPKVRTSSRRKGR